MLLDEGLWLNLKKWQNEKAEALASASHFVAPLFGLEPKTP